MAINFSNQLNFWRSSAISSNTGASALIKIYSGAAPANCDTAVTGTLLVTLTGAATFGTSTSGVMTLGAITSGTAVASGTAGYARVATSGGVAMFDITSIGTSGSDLNLNTTAIVTGGVVSISSGTITEPYP